MTKSKNSKSSLLNVNYNSFDWSMKPIILTLKFLGIHLLSSYHSVFCYVSFLFFGCISLAINLALNGYSIYNHLLRCPVTLPLQMKKYIQYGFRKLANGSIEEYQIKTMVESQQNSTKEDPTLHYPERTDHLSFVILVSGVHLSFTIIFYLTRRWRDVWENLLIINQLMKLRETFHRRIRKISFLALFLFFVVYISSKN